MRNFSYLVGEKNGAVAYIDPGWESQKIIDQAQKDGVKIEAVLLTHTHYDHSQELSQVLDQTGAFAYVEKTALTELQDLKNVQSVVDGDIIKVGGVEIKVLHTPGHREEAICFLAGKNLFTGDTLFINGTGRTDLPGGNASKLQQSLQKIAKLPEETVIYPGHDYGEVPFRTMGEEKCLNYD